MKNRDYILISVLTSRANQFTLQLMCTTTSNCDIALCIELKVNLSEQALEMYPNSLCVTNNIFDDTMNVTKKKIVYAKKHSYLIWW